MLKQENLAANFCGLLALKGYKEKAIEWRILGQEKDGSLLASWVSSCLPEFTPRSNIGAYNPISKSFDVLYSFPQRMNIIQASVNSSRTLLAFVVKDELENDCIEMCYKPFIVRINSVSTEENEPSLLLERNKQVMIQFLWKNQKNVDSNGSDKFVIMIHTETISLYTIDLSTQIIDPNLLKNEIIVRNFTWAQWDPIVQCLYYIHLKLVTKNLLEKEENRVESTPSLSAYQFNDNLPTETVLNIPLNLPKLPSNTTSDDVYEDDTIPLRIHDSSLNLIIVSDDIGMLFVCHYYLYKPVKPPEDSENDSVHFAYSVTVIHHGCVIHCVIPGIPWDKAKLMKPTFTLHGDHHMLVFQANLFMHLLDVGITHEPCCHIVCPPLISQNIITHLIPFLKWGSVSIDSSTLDLISINIPKSHLIEAFKQDNSIYNRLSIIHYFLVHSNDMESLVELLNIIIEKPLSLDTVSYLKEALIAGTYSSVIKSLPQDATELISLLPLTTSNILRPVHAKVSNLTVGLSHETLWNTTMMLLSPQQRLSPYRTDIWTRLWEKLNSNRKKSRFVLEEVADKLMYSLACYQPEALSRSSTPLTPAGPTDFSSADLCSNSRHNQNDVLPFIEFETCTASKQEHVISVNLRELSVYLVKNHAKYNTGFRWLKNSNFDKSPAPIHVHVVASQFATAQLDISRSLCVIICRAAGIDARVESVRGFSLIDQMSNTQQYTLFHILERYYLAAESLAFPVPQGFSSFFVYLGFRVLSFETFLQYAQTNVFELQIDVMKVILSDIDDTKQGIKRKLSLLLSLPQTRARRLLNYWNHPISLILRGRDHALNILIGNPVRIRTNSQSRRSAITNSEKKVNDENLTSVNFSKKQQKS